MLHLFYIVIFALSLVWAAAYICLWYKHFDTNFTVIFVLVPIACLGYVFYTGASSLDGLIMSMQIIYIGGCFLQLFIVYSIFNLCQIQLKTWVKVLLFLACAGCYLGVLTIGYTPWFYRSVTLVREGGGLDLVRTYGVLHTYFYLLLGLLVVTGVVTIVYSWFRRKQVPKRVLLLLTGADMACVLSYFVLRRLVRGIDLVPLGYCLSEFLYLLIASRANLYDVGNLVVGSMVQEGTSGYISFDLKYRYLGSNEMAKQLFPALRDMEIDCPISEEPSLHSVSEYLSQFRKDPQKDFKKNPYKTGEGEEKRIYIVNVRYLYQGRKKVGYFITFVDDTVNKKYIELMDHFNADLHEEVEQKTRHILQMQENLIMSMAMMVESRDNSTGGHIKRTSEGVHLLVEELKKEGSHHLEEKFCKDVIKAAPMHDLGKIAVDDAVLRKPGRFIPLEFEIMKKHAAEGARVIHVILLNTDDESFKKVAENVAHYHHERWDGSGYPEGLSGEQIPLEARIMAIADVYDALVSQRVYKEAFDFETADSIIRKGMGSQFDPGLENAYERARSRLEEYYRGNAS